MGWIKPLLTLQFWFKLTPPPLMPIFYWAFLIFFLLMLFASILCGRIYKKEKEQYLLRFGAKYLKNWFLTAGLVGFLLILFGYERAVLLSARFWYPLWVIGFGVWLFFIIKKIRELPKREAEFKHQAQFNKYLPKSKKQKSK
ncbi:hypothetical protein KJ885_01050 [Patescibacteria group bacterium]|nr:hypothetical protein [Patescibacteria group bacterium]